MRPSESARKPMVFEAPVAEKRADPSAPHLESQGCQFIGERRRKVLSSRSSRRPERRKCAMPTLSTNADNLTFTAANQQWIIADRRRRRLAERAQRRRHAVRGRQSRQQRHRVHARGRAVRRGCGLHPTGAGATSHQRQDRRDRRPRPASRAQAGGVQVDNDGSIVGFAGIGIDFWPGYGPRTRQLRLRLWQDRRECGARCSTASR